MSLYPIALLFVSIVVSVSSHYQCEYPSIYDFPSGEDEDYDFFVPSSKPPPPMIPTSHVHHHHNHNRKTTASRPTTVTEQHVPQTTFRPSSSSSQGVTGSGFGWTEPQATSRPSPPSIGSISSSTDVPPLAVVLSRGGVDLNNIQQTQMHELHCLDVLDRLISTKWQDEIDRLQVNDVGNFSTMIKVPEFSNYYSNPESEWIQEEGMALTKLDKCVRNVVSKAASRMDQTEIDCMNKLYPDYLSRESRTSRLTDMYIKETSKEQLPFRTFYNYFELTEILLNNKNIEALDDEQRALHEDIVDFYIKTEEDKTKKWFIVEKECVWKNSRFLREANSDNERYRRFGQLVKKNVNTYLVAEILRKWVPGAIIPEFRYNLWNKARSTMDNEISEKMSEFQRERRDAEYMCSYAAQFAEKFFNDQKSILFDGMKKTAQSANLRTYQKYSYVVALADKLKDKSDTRLSRVQFLLNEYKDDHYCLTNFVRMVENHQRYMIASSFVDEVLPYAHTYCLVKEMSAGLVNPRYCKCQGTFCEEFGMATLRAERFQLVLLPNNTYKVVMNPDYKPLALDELIANANQRIAEQKFNTWWYRHQKNPPALAMLPPRD